MPRHYSDYWLYVGAERREAEHYDEINQAAAENEADAYEALYQGTRFRVERAGGIVVRAGETVTDFRGETWEFLYGSAARVPGKTGKVIVADSTGHQREFYDTVFDLQVERR